MALFSVVKILISVAVSSTVAAILKEPVSSPGNSVRLNEGGYRRIAELNSNEEMGLFIRRVIKGMGYTILDEGALGGLVPFYSGVAGTQDLESLKKELASAAWVQKSAATPPALSPAPIAGKFLPVTQDVDNKDGATKIVMVPASESAPHKVQEQTSKALLINDSALPKVQDMLSKASRTLTEFEKDASIMQKQVKEKQEATRIFLLSAKKSLESRLSKIREDVAHLEDGNTHLKANISVVQEKNAKLRSEAGKIQRSITTLRDAMTAMAGKFGVAVSFAQESLNISESMAVPELAVLETQTPEPTLDYFLSQARKELGLKNAATIDAQEALSKALHPLSFLQTSGSVQEELSSNLGKSPKQYMNLLLKTLENLDLAEKQGVAKLHNSFDTAKAMLEKRSDALMKEQTKLMETLHKATEETASLRHANKKLMVINSSLLKEAEGFQVYLDRLDSAARNAVRLARDAVKFGL